jgi:hypothetical protein
MVSYNDVFTQLQDYMLNETNIQRFLLDKTMEKVSDKQKVSEYTNDTVKPLSEIKMSANKALAMFFKTEPTSCEVKTSLEKTSNKLIETPVKKTFQKSEVKPIKTEDKSLFIPKEQDSLFWCYFIIERGETEYEIFNHKTSLAAKQLKIEYIDNIRKNKQTLKTYKFDTLTNIESNLVNDLNINIKTVLSLCSIKNINIVFVKHRVYYELGMNDSDDYFIIRELNPNVKNRHNFVYGFERASKEKLEEIRNTLYKLDSIDKPIKAITAYKSQGILEFANKLSIETINATTGKTKTKKDLYEAIVQYLSG